VWVRTFETGQCTAEVFAQGVVAELRVALTPQQFLTRFASWDTGPFPGASTLLKALQPRFTLACLSNNNAVLWSNDRLQQLLPLFHAGFVSFENGVMKPERAAFSHVLTQMRLAPADILFFDDNPECVQTACAMGLVARQVQGLQRLLHSLQEFGIVV
jgi:putative hydrolase of the HAD superfamily